MDPERGYKTNRVFFWHTLALEPEEPFLLSFRDIFFFSEVIPFFQDRDITSISKITWMTWNLTFRLPPGSPANSFHLPFLDRSSQRDWTRKKIKFLSYVIKLKKTVFLSPFLSRRPFMLTLFGGKKKKFIPKKEKDLIQNPFPISYPTFSPLNFIIVFSSWYNDEE